MHKMTTALAGKLARQRAFWKRENHDRPLVGFTGSYFSADTVGLIGRDEGRVRPEDVNIERILAYTEWQFELWRDCTGDLFWPATQLYQFRWLAAALGAPVFAGGDSVWVEPFVKDYAQIEALTFEPDSPWLQKLWALTDAMVDQAAGRYPVAANEFMSPLSALADLRGNTEFAFDLYDRPQHLAPALEAFTELWCTFVTEQYKRIPSWHGGYPSAQRFIWAPGKVSEFSEDPVFMLSPRFHRDLVVPSHRMIVDRVEYAYIHLHSTQLHTLDSLLEMDDLVAIELTPDHGQEIPDLLPTMAKIRDRKPLIVHAFMTAEEVGLIARELPPEGLCIISRVETPEDAARLQDQVLK
jgi:hypothetical protein